MGQLLSRQPMEIFKGIQQGELPYVERVVQENPSLLNNARYSRHSLSPLHLAASLGRIEVLVLLLDHGARVDVMDQQGKTPLFLACKLNRWNCAKHLLDHGAKAHVSGGRNTCLHYAAKAGNVDCVKAMLLDVASSTLWDVIQFVNKHNNNGITALHLACLNGHVSIVQNLLRCNANISALSLPFSQYKGFGGRRSALHYAAIGGSVDCVKELLAWGADKFQQDCESCTPYTIALAYRHFACAEILDPRRVELLVWPSPVRFMNELEPEAKHILESTLLKVNQSRLHASLDAEEFSQSFSQELRSSHKDVCCICFEHVCNIHLGDCGHEMCAACILRVCCSSREPMCPFCRCYIGSISVSRKHSVSSSGRFKRKASGRIAPAET